MSTRRIPTFYERLDHGARMTITLSGPPGSGTTTLACLLTERLGFRHVNTGQIFRDLALEHGMSLPEFGLYATEHGEVDEELDRRQLEFARQGGIVLEGRLAGHLTHRHKAAAFRIFLEAALELRAERVAVRDCKVLHEARAEMVERARIERARFLDHYQVDIKDMAIYDLVLDSAVAGPEALAEKVLCAYLSTS